MALTVETGAGLSTAESYVSVSEITAYMTKFNKTPTGWAALAEAIKESHARIASQYVDARYASQWQGRRSVETQALAWPRASVVDLDGFTISHQTIPERLKTATIEAAIRSASGTSLMGDLAAEGSLKERSVKIGPLEETLVYANPSDQLPVFPLIDNLLRSYLDGAGSGSGSSVVRLTRA